jgi:hypothetical protein
MFSFLSEVQHLGVGTVAVVAGFPIWAVLLAIVFLTVAKAVFLLWFANLSSPQRRDVIRLNRAWRKR